MSLLLTAAAAVPMAHLVAEPLLRAQRLSQLGSKDAVRFARALAYVAKHGSDPRVLTAAIRRLGHADPQRFEAIRHALDQGGQWRRPAVGDAVWIRWLGSLASDPTPPGRILAAEHAAALTDLAPCTPAIRLLERLIEDNDADVRYAALQSAARLAGIPGATPKYHRLMTRAAKDPNALVARDAWLVAGVLGMKLPIGDLKNAPAPVAEAMLWSLLAANGDSPSDDLAAMLETAPADARWTAAYALRRCPQHQTALEHLVAADFVGDDPLHRWRRAVLAPLESLAATDVLQNMHEDPTQPPTPQRCALAHRLAAHGRRTAPLLASAVLHPLLQLAILEGHSANTEFRLHRRWSPVVTLAAIAAGAPAAPQDLRPALSHPQSTIRDWACVVASQRFLPSQQESLVAKLLGDFDDRAKMSGAILAGLTGTQTALLTKKMLDEDVWSVQQVHRLGVWMQQQGADFDPASSGLLGRQDVPRSTVLLAMLHRDRRAALDHLLNRSAPADLREQLVHGRWWHVLQRYLPPDAPPLWLWADPQLQQFQLDVLRVWHGVGGWGSSEQ